MTTADESVTENEISTDDPTKPKPTVSINITATTLTIPVEPKDKENATEITQPTSTICK